MVFAPGDEQFAAARVFAPADVELLDVKLRLDGLYLAQGFGVFLLCRAKARDQALRIVSHAPLLFAQGFEKGLVCSCRHVFIVTRTCPIAR